MKAWGRGVACSASACAVQSGQGLRPALRCWGLVGEIAGEVVEASCQIAEVPHLPHGAEGCFEKAGVVAFAASRSLRRCWLEPTGRNVASAS